MGLVSGECSRVRERGSGGLTGSQQGVGGYASVASDNREPSGQVPRDSYPLSFSTGSGSGRQVPVHFDKVLFTLVTVHALNELSTCANLSRSHSCSPHSEDQV